MPSLFLNTTDNRARSIFCAAALAQGYHAAALLEDFQKVEVVVPDLATADAIRAAVEQKVNETTTLAEAACGRPGADGYLWSVRWLTSAEDAVYLARDYARYRPRPPGRGRK